MATILGISAFFHDSAAALVVDGEIVAAAEEERFSRRKHDAAFPASAIRYCLSRAGDPPKIDAVAYHENPALLFDRVVGDALASGAEGRMHWIEAASAFASKHFKVVPHIRSIVGDAAIYSPDHHLSHAAAAFYPSPFRDAAILIVDGVGEHATTSIGQGRGNQIELVQQIEYPHSIGLLYAAFTHYCGFRVNSGEYKLMGLAPFGEPRYVDLIKDNLIDLRDDGSFRLSMEYFGFTDSKRVINSRFEDLFGRPARAPESRIDSFMRDVAASAQRVIEDVMSTLARQALRVTGSQHLCMAGGVALNCVANGLIARRLPPNGLWIQPAAGDAGGALGAALLVAHAVLDEPRPHLSTAADGQHGSYLGPSFDGDAVESVLRSLGCTYSAVSHDDKVDITARALAAGDIVAWFQGRMEFGPRALGARSILADARSSSAQENVNTKIKFRESWRPFAPIVLEERAAEYFELDGESPYMLVTAQVRVDKRTEAMPPAIKDDDLVEAVRVPRSVVPAVTHVDYSARVQTVSRARNPLLHDLLSHFDRIAGVPILVNTSLNVRGEPIVCTPLDAIHCFFSSDLDLLVIGDFIVRKSENLHLMIPPGLRTRHEID